MASIDKRPDGRYRARWREYPGGPQKTKSFARKVDAQNWLTEVSHRLLSGTYTPPEAGQVTLSAYAAEWVGRRHWRPSTRERVERTLRLHILPELGARPLASLRRSHVEEWLAGLPLAPSSAGAVYQTLRAMLGAAVADERIPRNPAVGARCPRIEKPPFVPLSADEVRALAGEMVEHIRAAVLLAAGTGLRQGELFGVTVDRVDFLRRELRVDRQLWTPRAGSPVLVPPKAANSYRTVALSPLTVDVLSAHLGAFRPGDDGLVFHAEGRPVSRGMGSAYMRRAALRAALEATTWHDLRHHHASVLLSAGVSPALVAERLGHDVKTLLGTYAHVIRSDEDRVRGIVDGALGGTAEDWLRTEAV
jgi:integrase